MKKKMDKDLKVGIFVTLGLVLVLGALLTLGGANNVFTRQNNYTTHFKSTQGLIAGAKVVLSGVPVGTIKDVDYDAKDKNVKVTFSVARKYAQYMKQGTIVEILTQGVLGDKFISIDATQAEGEEIADGSEVPTRVSDDLAQIIPKADQLMTSLNSIAVNLDKILKNFDKGGRSDTFFQGMSTTAKNLAQVSDKLNRQLDGMQLPKISRELNSIMEKVNNGTGTVGALINDPSLYNDFRALVGGANRNRIMRNLVRKTVKDSETAEEPKK